MCPTLASYWCEKQVASQIYLNHHVSIYFQPFGTLWRIVEATVQVQRISHNNVSNTIDGEHVGSLIRFQISRKQGRFWCTQWREEIKQVLQWMHRSENCGFDFLGLGGLSQVSWLSCLDVQTPTVKKLTTNCDVSHVIVLPGLLLVGREFGPEFGPHRSTFGCSLFTWTGTLPLFGLLFFLRALLPPPWDFPEMFLMSPFLLRSVFV